MEADKLPFPIKDEYVRKMIVDYASWEKTEEEDRLFQIYEVKTIVHKFNGVANGYKFEFVNTNKKLCDRICINLNHYFFNIPIKRSTKLKEAIKVAKMSKEKEAKLSKIRTEELEAWAMGITTKEYESYRKYHDNSVSIAQEVARNIEYIIKNRNEDYDIKVISQAIVDKLLKAAIYKIKAELIKDKK